MSLTRIESETGINYNDEEDTAIVYTANSSLMRKLDDLCKKFPKEFQRHILVGDDEEIKSYRIPKKCIIIRTPTIYSEADKKRMSESGKRLAEVTNQVPNIKAKTKDNNKKV